MYPNLKFESSGQQNKRPTEVKGNPMAPFSIASTVTYGIDRNPRQGWAPLLSRCMLNLSPVNTGTHFNHHKWMESWVNFGAYGSGYL